MDVVDVEGVRDVDPLPKFVEGKRGSSIGDLPTKNGKANCI